MAAIDPLDMYCEAILATVLKPRKFASGLRKFDPDQPRVPKGEEGGGQWTSGAAGGGSSSFDMEGWKSKAMADMGGARAEFYKIPRAERDRMANPRESIPARMTELLGNVQEMPQTGYLPEDIREFVGQWSNEIGVSAIDRMEEVGLSIAVAIEETGLFDHATGREVLTDALQHLAAQEIEGQTRSLGDHGAHHLLGDMRLSQDILSKIPGAENTPENRLMLALASVYHDSGYLTPVARAFFDNDHPRWSAQYFSEHIAPKLTETMGKNWVQETTRIMEGHAGTTIDWEREPLMTAFSMADNLALFHEEKMPPFARLVPTNIDTLVRLAKGELDLPAAREQMRANIAKAAIPPAVKGRLDEAVKEVSPVLPKFMLGMVGTRMEKTAWVKDHLEVTVARTKANEQLSRVLDMGQKQFIKLVETYSPNYAADPQRFLKERKIDFNDPKDGHTLLRVNLTGPIWDLEGGGKAWLASLLKGDFEGHPFRGNQYVSGEFAGGGMRDMVDRIRQPDGGFTYSPSLKSEPKGGYALSVHPERSRMFAASKMAFMDLVRYARDNADLLSQDGNYIGAWHDPQTGNVFLDVSTVTQDRAEAERLCRDHDQIAYFDLQTFQSVDVNRTATSGGVTKGNRHEQTSTASLAALAKTLDRRGTVGPVREADGAQADAGGTRASPSRDGATSLALMKEWVAPASPTSGIQPYGSKRGKRSKARRRPRPKKAQ